MIKNIEVAVAKEDLFNYWFHYWSDPVGRGRHLSICKTGTMKLEQWNYKTRLAFANQYAEKNCRSKSLYSCCIRLTSSTSVCEIRTQRKHQTFSRKLKLKKNLIMLCTVVFFLIVSRNTHKEKTTFMQICKFSFNCRNP